MMNRAFVSFYLIIVLSIILLGLVLNKLWDMINPIVDTDPAIEDIFNITEAMIAKNILLNIHSIYPQLHYQINIINLENFSKTKISEDIKDGKIINASDGKKIIFYRRMKNNENVLSLTYDIEKDQKTSIYIIFLIIFYFAIAVIIFFWVWPFSKDLAKLAHHAKTIGKEEVPQHIEISPRSIIFPFAIVFNAMVRRLNDSISSRKEMTYAVSHELRTPLARTKFSLAILEENELSAAVREQLTSIHKDVHEMESLMNALLAYAGFEQQSQLLIQKPGHIIDLIHDVVASLFLKKKSYVEITIYDDTNGKEFFCEWSLMHTALKNIVDNALDFAQKKITITAKISDVAYILLIEDDGPGIAFENQQKVFEPFVRFSAGEYQRSSFGLGLAITRRILNWHQGNARCFSIIQSGILFELSWPKVID